MSQNDGERIVAAAQRLRNREGARFTLTQLARPAGMSRATLYRRLAADNTLATEIERIRTEGVRSPKDEFLRAATSVLAERGLAELTMEAVAERAGLSIATLYRTFTDRDSLVRETLRTSFPAEPLRKILMSEGTLEEVLTQFVKALLHRFHEHPHMLRLLMQRTTHDLQEFRRFRRDEERMSTSLIAFLERHQSEHFVAEPKQVAAMFMGHVLGVIMFQRSHDAFPMPNAATIVRLFLDGARRRNVERTGP